MKKNQLQALFGPSIKRQMLAHMIQTDVPTAIIGHEDFNCRAIELKRKAIGDLCHDVLFVLCFPEMEGHMTFHLPPY